MDANELRQHITQTLRYWGCGSINPWYDEEGRRYDLTHLKTVVNESAAELTFLATSFRGRLEPAEFKVTVVVELVDHEAKPCPHEGCKGMLHVPEGKRTAECTEGHTSKPASPYVEEF